nr:hypothetical protein [Tanacetum cinerariifolium]
MDTTIDQQVAMDEALVPHAKTLRIGRSNFRLLSDISFKESTLQLVYDVLRLTPFFKAFLVTADVLEIYMQEFWATATVHHYSILFKMDNKKHIVNLESFRDMLRICPRLPGQSFVKPPFKEEILPFFVFLDTVEHKDTKKSNEMYYPRFMKVIINHFMSKDPSILRSNKVNSHYVRDDHMFTTIKLVSRHQNTQQFGTMLPIELTNADIKNSNAYKEYHAVATGATPPKPKASVRKIKSSSDITVTPPTATVAMTEAQQLKLATKRSLQQTHISQVSSSGTDEGTGKDGDGDDEGDDDDDDEQDDDDARDDDEEEDEGDDEEDDQEEGSDDDQASDEEEFIHPNLSTHAEEEIKDGEIFDPIPKTPEDTDDEGNGEENLGINVTPPFWTMATTIDQQVVIINVGREEGHDEDKLYRDVNINQGRGIQTTQEFKDSHVTLTPSGRLRNEAQKENDEFLKTIDENMQKNIKEQVKEQVKTSYDVAADLSEMELKKILIEKMKGNKSIHRSNEQRNLYKALVKAYESDKIILDTYRDTVTLKRRRNDDVDKDEEPSIRSDRGSKGRREGKEPESTSAPKETTFEMEEPSYLEFKTGADDQPIIEPSQHPEWGHAKLGGARILFGRSLQGYNRSTRRGYPEGQQYPYNLLKPLPLISDSLGHRVIPFDNFINNDLEYLYGSASSCKYTTSVTKTKAADYKHIKWIEDLVPRTMWIQEPVGYDKHAL